MKRLLFICLIQILIGGNVFARDSNENLSDSTLLCGKIFGPRIIKTDNLLEFSLNLRNKVYLGYNLRDTSSNLRGSFNSLFTSEFSRGDHTSLSFIKPACQVNKNISLIKFNLKDSLSTPLNIFVTLAVEIGKLQFACRRIDFSELYNDALLMTPDRPFTPQEEFFIYRDVMNDKLSRAKYDPPQYIDSYRMKRYSLVLIDFKK